MSLIIPPPRSLGREGLAALAIGLQQNRIREEQRERQEEAADAGSGALGGALGSAAGMGIGALLAAPTGGVSLLAGAAIGGGIGTAAGTGIGAAIDPAGSGFPGGTSGIVARGLQTGTQQVLGGLGIMAQQAETERREGVRAAEIERGREFQLELTELGQTFRATESGRAREAAVLRPFGQTPADVTAFVNSPEAAGLTGTPAEIRRKARLLLMNQAAQVQAARKQQAVIGQRFANAEADAEIKQYQAWQKDPDAFSYNSHQVQTRKVLEGVREDIETLEPDRLSPEEFQQARSNLRRKERTFVRRLKKKPRTPQSVEEVNASGGFFEPGRAYTFGPPDTATQALYITARGSQIIPWGAGQPTTSRFVESKELPGTFFSEDTSGKRTFGFKTLLDGRKVGTGDLWEHPAVGWVQYNEKGKLEPWEQKQPASIPDFNYDKARTEITKHLQLGVPVLDQEGRPVKDKKGVPETRDATQEDVERALDKAAEHQLLREHKLKNQQILLSSESRRELFARLERDDPKLSAARQIVENWQQVSLPDLQDAVDYMRARIEAVVLDTDDKGKVVRADMPKTLRQDLAEYNRLLEDIIARRKISFFLGIR